MIGLLVQCNTLSAVIGGKISGGGGLIKNDAATLELYVDNTYSGATTINAGAVVVVGSQPMSAVTINAGGTLGGTGRVGAITVNGGTVSPHRVLGGGRILSSNTAVFSPGSTFIAELDGTGAGGFAQLNVSGSVDLGNSTLSASLGSVFAPVVGDTFTIIQSSGDPQHAHAFYGTFNGLPDGTLFAIGSTPFRINYTANAAVLTRVLATDTWTGLGADDKWSTPGNWQAGVAPGRGDDLLFPIGASRLANRDDFIPMCHDDFRAVLPYRLFDHFQRLVVHDVCVGESAPKSTAHP